MNDGQETNAVIEIMKGNDNPVADFFSSPSNTPDTDALNCELHNPRVLSDRYSEMMEHAQKLERERDEVRQQNAKLRDIAERILLNCETLHPNTVKLHRAELDQLK
jgi:hypothetical protein